MLSKPMKDATTPLEQVAETTYIKPMPDNTGSEPVSD